MTHEQALQLFAEQLPTARLGTLRALQVFWFVLDSDALEMLQSELKVRGALVV